MKVIGSRAQWCACLSHRPAPTPSVERDETITRSSECRDLIFPILAAARTGVQEHNRHTVSAGILVPNADTRQVRIFLASLRCREGCERHEVNEKHDSLHKACLPSSHDGLLVC